MGESGSEAIRTSCRLRNVTPPLNAPRISPAEALREVSRGRVSRGTGHDLPGRTAGSSSICGWNCSVPAAWSSRQTATAASTSRMFCRSAKAGIFCVSSGRWRLNSAANSSALPCLVLISSRLPLSSMTSSWAKSCRRGPRSVQELRSAETVSVPGAGANHQRRIMLSPGRARARLLFRPRMPVVSAPMAIRFIR